MRLLIEATAIFTKVNGARVRVWKGHTYQGTAGDHLIPGAPCTVFVAGVAVPEGWTGPFEAELEETSPPRELDEAIQAMDEETRGWGPSHVGRDS